MSEILEKALKECGLASLTDSNLIEKAKKGNRNYEGSDDMDEDMDDMMEGDSDRTREDEDADLMDKKDMKRKPKMDEDDLDDHDMDDMPRKMKKAVDVDLIKAIRQENKEVANALGVVIQAATSEMLGKMARLEKGLTDQADIISDQGDTINQLSQSLEQIERTPIQKSYLAGNEETLNRFPEVESTADSSNLISKAFQASGDTILGNEIIKANVNNTPPSPASVQRAKEILNIQK